MGFSPPTFKGNPEELCLPDVPVAMTGLSTPFRGTHRHMCLPDVPVAMTGPATPLRRFPDEFVPVAL